MVKPQRVVGPGDRRTEIRDVGAVILPCLWIAGHANSAKSPSVKVCGSRKDNCLIRCDSFNLVSPFPGEFESSFNSFRTSIHGKNGSVAKIFGNVAGEDGEDVIVECAGGEGEALGLGDEGGDYTGMTVALIDSGVGGEEVEVFAALGGGLEGK